MKLSKPSILLAAALCASGPLTALSAPMASPGRVDFGNFTPSTSGAEFVEINISSTLISMVAQLVEKHEPEVAQVINGLRSIKVNVVGIDNDNRADLEKRARDLREQLVEKGWESVVTVKKQDQDVGIYLKAQNKDTVQGLTAVVFEGNKHAVFINIDGNIKPEQLSMIGERLHMEELKKAGRHTKPKKNDDAEKE